MSGDADARSAATLPPAWERLEAAAHRAGVAVQAWRGRAIEAEAEVVRLREQLEALAAEAADSPQPRDVVRRLRAENAALRSRLGQARRRIGTLLAWTDALEESR